MKELIRRVARISSWTWLYLFIASSIICILALRHNNQTMVSLREKVYVADKNNGDVNTALNNLRRYVYAHMNTDLNSGNNNIKPPIQLKYTYQRLLDSEQAQLQAANSSIYVDAQNYCQAQPGATGLLINGSVPCVQNYVVNHGVDTTLPPIPAGLYQFDFISPAWSPDLAGFSLIASILLLIACVARFGSGKLKR